VQFGTGCVLTRNFFFEYHYRRAGALGQHLESYPRPGRSRALRAWAG
jgi:hypothetical protein